jgi:hypothetical protein
MEAILDLLQTLSLNLLEVMFLSILIFGSGYLLGLRKVKKLNHKIYGLQRDVLDLNAEILFGKEDSKGSETPVIEIKHDSLKGSKIAR